MGNLLFFTKKGMIKKSDWAEYDGQKKNLFAATKLVEEDEVIAVEEDLNEDDTIMIVTEGGVCLNAKKDDIPTQGRIATGVRGIQLREGDSVTFMSQVGDEGEIIVATSDGKFKKVIASQIDVTGRYKKGSMIVALSEGEKVLAVSYVKKPYAVAIVEKNKAVKIVSSGKIPILLQSTRARKLPGIDEGNVMEVHPLFYQELDDED
jgi:topoisomerase-4 subunit A